MVRNRSIKPGETASAPGQDRELDREGGRRGREPTVPKTHNIEPYGSALDLPTVQEMLVQVKGGKILTRIIARDQRATFIKVEEQVRELSALIDRFYLLLGPRNWIFHDRLSTKALGALVALEPARAERALIELYQNPETLRLSIMSLRRFPELQARMPQIEQASVDYFEGRYYATVQTLLSVMDGFVNDVERSSRRGLHAREADEMCAWDSVVGHHLGLTHAHRSFTKSFNKTVTEEVFELYRHGIVHGMVVNFNNDVVATKAWNRLFAVVDWATSRQKQQVPPQPKPGWRDLLHSIEENHKAKEALAQWQPSSFTPNAPEFETDEVVVMSTAYLAAWHETRYGLMADLLSPLVSESTTKHTAGMVARDLGSCGLGGFAVTRVDHRASAVTEVDVQLVLDGETKEAAMRWIRSDGNGMVTSPNQEGSWGLMTWTSWAMINQRRRTAS